jgi:exodeoxyribonuclease V gamma subunit
MRRHSGKIAAMPGRPDFRLYHSNALEVLAGLLAEQVSRAPADGDWLRPDLVLVPQFSMRRWLQQVLAERMGVCANLRFLTPGEYVDLVLDANLGPAAPADRLAPETLRWHLLRELCGQAPAPLAGFLAGGDPLKSWSLANALAESYEKYQAWRREWLLDWERRPSTDDWQAALWRRVGRDRRHRARRIDDYLRRVELPLGLPPRMFVFACQNISPDVLQMIASQARVGEQHFYLHTPARAFWGDLDRWSGYTPAADDEFLGGDGAPSPLLAAWGQAGRDFIAGIVGGESVAPAFEIAPHVQPPQDNLLGRLQGDVLDNRMPLAGNTDPHWPRAQVDREDASVQFHACHTRLREVQVLHDQLRALLEVPEAPGRPALQPREIAVLAPNIDLYAPHIEAVFGGALGTARELPYTIADSSPLATSPLAEAFLRLIELPLHALTVTDVFDLLAVPAIAAHFGIDDNQRGALQDWLDIAGARWGLDAADRARHDAFRRDGETRDDHAYTFEFAIDRLLLGYATGAGDDIDGAGGIVAPWPELEGQAAVALDGLLRLLAVLRRAAARLGAAQPPQAWTRELESLIDDLFGEDGHEDEDAAVLKALRQVVADFARGAAQAAFDAPVEHAIVLAHLRSELGASDARAPFLSGGICFGRMVPMRLIPFQVICLLGMDEAAFPARDGRDPVNRIAQALDTRDRRVGDPSRRDADRYLFLQLFASAGRTFYMSWIGMDPRDNARREPSALVAELLDAAARYHAGDVEQTRRALVVRHALQPFSPAAFGAAHADEVQPDSRRFSFDARWREAAREPLATRAEPVFAPPSLCLPLAAEAAEDSVALDRLRSTLLRPHAAYLGEGLGLRLPEDEPPLDEHEPLGKPDALMHHQLREQVLQAWLRDRARPQIEALRAALLARAQLAPGADGRATVEALLEEVAPFAHAALAAGFGSVSHRLPVEHPIGARMLRGALAGVQAPGVLRVAMRAKGRNGNAVLRHGLDWLVASLLERPLHELYIDQPGDAPVWRVRAPEREQAMAVLQSLIGVREQALREPLPFLPKSAYTFYLASDPERGLRDASQQWCGDDRTAAESGPATQMAMRGRDPFVDGDAAGLQRFKHLAVAVFDAVEHGRAFDMTGLDTGVAA